MGRPRGLEGERDIERGEKEGWWEREIEREERKRDGGRER